MASMMKLILPKAKFFFSSILIKKNGPSPALRASSPQGARKKLHLFVMGAQNYNGIFLQSKILTFPSPLGERVSHSDG
jgi:hypothetical protein